MTSSDSAETLPRQLARRPWRSLAVPRARWLSLAGLAFLVGVAALLRFRTLGHQRLWYDESLTAMEAHLSFGSMLWTVTHEEITPPLFYTLEWAIVHVFGDSAVALRALSAVAGVAVVPIAYWIAASLAGARAGLLAGALVSFNPLLVWYSQEARSYSLLVLLSALGLLAFVKLMSTGGARWLGVWTAASVLALLTHFFAGFVVAPQAVWLLSRRRANARVKAAVGLVALVQLALVPYAYLRSSDGTGWIAHIPLWQRVVGLPIHFLGGFGGTAYVLTVLLGIACVGSAVWAIRARRRAEHGNPRVVAWIGLLGLAVPLAVAVAGVDLIVTRNLVGALVPLAVALACGLALVRPPWASALLVAAFCGVAALGISSVDARPALEKPDWVSLARLLGPARTNRAIAVSAGLPLQLYMPRTWWAGKRPVQAVLHLPNHLWVREIDVVGTYPPRVNPCWWGASCNVAAATPTSIPPAPGFRLASKRRRGFFEVVRWTSRRPHLVHRRDPSFARYRIYGRRYRRNLVVLLQLSDRTPTRVIRRLHFPPQLGPN